MTEVLPPFIFPEDGTVSLSSPLVRAAIYRAHGGVDFYTRAPIHIDSMVLDHVWPKSKGGPDNLFNLVPTTQQINALKHAKMDAHAVAAVLAIVRTYFGPRSLSLLREIAAMKVRKASRPSKPRRPAVILPEVTPERTERLWARLREAPGRSPAYRWFQRRRDWFEPLLKEARPSWPAIAVLLAQEEGLVDKDGKPLKPETLRHAWWRVQRDSAGRGKVAGRARGDGAKAPVVVETGATATDAPPAAEVQEPAVEVDDYKPQRGSLRSGRKEEG